MRSPSKVIVPVPVVIDPPDKVMFPAMLRVGSLVLRSRIPSVRVKVPLMSNAVVGLKVVVPPPSLKVRLKKAAPPESIVLVPDVALKVTVPPVWVKVAAVLLVKLPATSKELVEALKVAVTPPMPMFMVSNLELESPRTIVSPASSKSNVT